MLDPNKYTDDLRHPAPLWTRPPHTDAEREAAGYISRRVHLLAACVAVWGACCLFPALPTAPAEPPAVARAAAPGQQRPPEPVGRVNQWGYEND